MSHRFQLGVAKTIHPADRAVTSAMGRKALLAVVDSGPALVQHRGAAAWRLRGATLCMAEAGSCNAQIAQQPPMSAFRERADFAASLSDGHWPAMKRHSASLPRCASAKVLSAYSTPRRRLGFGRSSDPREFLQRILNAGSALCCTKESEATQNPSNKTLAIAA